MDRAKKHFKVIGVFDNNLIYSGVTGRWASRWDIDFKDVLGHNLQHMKCPLA